MSYNSRYAEYLNIIHRPFKKLSRLEFLQPDYSVAFSLTNRYNPEYNQYDSRAFLQSGELNVALQNGQRRQASVTLANIDKKFDYAFNKQWFGQAIRMSMGVELSDGTPFYIPQGVFYIQNPSSTVTHNTDTITYTLVDKWNYLNGILFGKLDGAYQIDTSNNIFNAMASILTLSKYDYNTTYSKTAQIDCIPPVFTPYYNGKSYTLDTGGTAAMTDVPYTIIVNGDNSSFADVLLELNSVIVGMIGYDNTGALRVEPSQEDIEDTDKPIQYSFTADNSLISINENIMNTNVYNDIIITGESLSGYEVFGRATNYDPSSPTNVNIIGRKTYRESNAAYWNSEQCVALAKFKLKQMTALQKSISIESTQMFHLQENGIISVQRPDKENATEKHLIQSFTLPIGEQGTMSINALSVNDIPNLATTTTTERSLI